MSSLGWFATGAGTWFTTWGMNSLVFSWLVVGVLELEDRLVGVAQSSTMLPSLFLLLFGGAVADRLEPRRLLIVLHFLATLPVLTLIGVLGNDALTFPLLLTYGATLGTIQAFVTPARDALLSRVAGQDLMAAVTLLTMTQFGGQAFGTLIAGQGQSYGLSTVLFAQAGILAFGGLTVLGIRNIPPQPAGSLHDSAWRQIREGIGIVVRSPHLRVPVFLVTLVGVLFIGPFLVAFPILVREYYGGGASELSFVLMTFPIGTILGSVAIRARGGIRRRGQALLLALSVGACTMLVMASGLSYEGFVAAGVVWGLGGSIFINSSRALVQENAPPDARGRVLAAYQVGFTGGGPIGSLLAGLFSEAYGPLATLGTAGALMLAMVLAVGLLTDARRLT